MTDILNHITNVAVSGWLSAIIFGVIFSVIFHKYFQWRELNAAKKVLKEELTYNLNFMAFVYWKCYESKEGDLERDIQIPCVSLFESYAPIIIKNYPHVSKRLIWLFSAFKQVNSLKEPISTQEDVIDYFGCAEELNEELNLGLDSEYIQQIRIRNYSIR